MDLFSEAPSEQQHRDLHWGNILIKEPENLDAAFNKLSLATKSRQTKQERELSVSVIDFTLTRMRASNGHIIFDDFACEELFEGEGSHPAIHALESMTDHACPKQATSSSIRIV